MNELVSIIVPVYNVKEYLSKCVCSIMNQTYTNLQIILIDDGSTDGSSEICDLLSERDRRIQVIHKENGGVVSARREGILRANGRYALFVDSDDWIDENMVESLLHVAMAKNADIVTSGFYREDGKISVRYIEPVKADVYCGVEGKEILYSRMMYDKYTSDTGISPALFNKLIKTSILRDIIPALDDSIVYGEDIAIIYASCILADNIVVTHEAYYHYLIRNHSAARKTYSNYLNIISGIYTFLKKYCEHSQYKDILLRQLELHMVYQLLKGINFHMGFDRGIHIPYFDFNKDVMENGSKVLLYGAGKVGQAFYKHISVERKYELVGWVDRNYKKFQEQGMDVQAVEYMLDVEYDYIILAFKDKERADRVKKMLVSTYGIDSEKMLWLEPISIINTYCL